MTQLGQRIKLLRKEKGWSQDELGKQINADIYQVSRYENERVTPSVETVIRLAKAFDVSLDYLLIEESPRRPLKMPHNDLMDRLQEIQHLTEEDRKSLLNVLDGLLAKNKLKSLAREFG
jgi:transcriptional regulator with XRE-family HTH domain